MSKAKFFFIKYHLTSVNFIYLIVTKMLFKFFQERQVKKIISYTQPYQFDPIVNKKL